MVNQDLRGSMEDPEAEVEMETEEEMEGQDAQD